MPFTLDDFIRIRPCLYHLTARENLTRIRSTGQLFSTELLIANTARSDLLRERRRESVQLNVGGETVVIRDQAPLHEGNMDLEPGWTQSDFVEHLNQRVFFWPGREDGPISYGLRHFARYEAERPEILRVRLESLLASNAGVTPEFCRFNSGSPRCNQGRRSPRSSRTFVGPDDVDFRPSDVVEVTFRGAVALPLEFEVGASPRGPWRAIAPVGKGDK